MLAQNDHEKWPRPIHCTLSLHFLVWRVLVVKKNVKFSAISLSHLCISSRSTILTKNHVKINWKWIFPGQLTFALTVQLFSPISLIISFLFVIKIDRKHGAWSCLVGGALRLRLEAIRRNIGDVGNPPFQPRALSPAP